MNTFFSAKKKPNKLHRERISKSLHRRGLKKKNKKKQFGLYILVHKAVNLPASDANGFSDPYVRFKLGNRKLGKTKAVPKTLNPVWEEQYFTLVPGVDNVLKLEVWDKDWDLTNDYLGEVSIDLSEHFKDIAISDELFEEKALEFEKVLVNKKTNEKAGRIFFSLQQSRKIEKKIPKKWSLHKSSVVKKQLVVDLVSGQNLIVMDKNGTSDPSCVLTFQGVSRQSRVGWYTLAPMWKQRFDFAYNLDEDADESEGEPRVSNGWPQEVSQDKLLNIEIFDNARLSSKKVIMGEAKINIAQLSDQHGGANEVWAEVTLNNQPAGMLLLYVSILDVYGDHKLSSDQQASNPAVLRVHMIQAQKAKSSGAKKVCYMEAQVGKNKFRSKPVEDCEDPEFNHYIEIPVKNIFAILQLSLCEKKHNKWEQPADIVGKLEIPAFHFFHNKNMQPTWLNLKKADFSGAAKAQIRISCQLIYTYSWRTFFQLLKRHEEDPLFKKESTSIQRLRHQIGRASYGRKELLDGIKGGMGLLKWDYGPYPSLLGMALWFLYCFFYRHWFLPLTVFSFLMFSRHSKQLYFGYQLTVDVDGVLIETKHNHDYEAFINELEERDEANDEEEVVEPQAFSLISVRDALPNIHMPQFERAAQGEKRASFNFKAKRAKTGIIERYDKTKMVLRTVQHSAETIADYYEQMKGIAFWSNPDFTRIIAFGSFLATILLMFVPLYIVAIVAVEWQFIKRGLRKYKIGYNLPEHRVPWNPLIHFLKKVHTHEQKLRFAKVMIDPQELEELEKKNLNFERLSNESVETKYIKD